MKLSTLPADYVLPDEDEDEDEMTDEECDRYLAERSGSCRDDDWERCKHIIPDMASGISAAHVLAQSRCDDPLTKREATELVENIRSTFADAYERFCNGKELLAEAYRRKAWEPLELQDWTDFVRHTFDSSHIKFPKTERTHIVNELARAGLPLRAIATVIGAGIGTVHRDLHPDDVPNGTRRVVNQQGKKRTTLPATEQPLCRIEKLLAKAEDPAATLPEALACVRKAVALFRKEFGYS